MVLRFWILLLFLSWAYTIPVTHQLQTYQIQLLFQLSKHLEYPSQLQGWENYTGDFCSMASSPYVKISCQADSISELRIVGHKSVKTGGTNFNGFAIPGRTLSKSFSIDSFFTTLTSFPRLRAVSLVSLGIWGSLPEQIHRLHSLELLDMSDNFLYGSIPPKISTMSSLKSFTLDSNFFNNTLPNWWDSLYNLSVLSLKDNCLQGSFPSSLIRVAKLTDLSLSGNNLSGKIADLSNLHNLHLLDLRQNQFDSVLPKMSNSVVTILLSRNSLTGAVPEQFSELAQLQHLDLSYNLLSGSPPVALFSLPNLSYLNLGSNRLSGSISDELKCGNELGFLDVSNNRLTGGLPPCLKPSLGKIIVRYGGNCLSVSAQKQHQESYCPKKRSLQILFSQKERVLFIIVIVGVIILLLLMLLLALILLKKCKKQSRKMDHHMFPKAVQENQQIGLCSDLLANARMISQAAKAGSQGTPTYRVFSMEELENATNGFNASTFLGQGSAGKIYKGKLTNGTYVAIRCLCLYGKHSSQRLILRLDLLSKLRHPHLVALLGHYLDEYGHDQCYTSRVFLVYEYVPCGSFRLRLSESSPQRLFTWADRLAILVDVAKAVHFLHTGVVPGSFHNQLRTNNILLDENGVAKLSDYGITIITDDVEKPERKGDGAKAWKMKIVEDDVYNFGFILLEALVGPTVAGNRDALLLNGMTSFGSQDGRWKIVDPLVLRTSSQESLSRVISITNKCISAEVSARPSFQDVLWNLQYAAQVQSASDADLKASDATLLYYP